MVHEVVMDYTELGNNIRKIRIQKGMAQITLAKAIGVSQTHMSNIENGNTGISLLTAIKISKQLDCSIDSLVNIENNVDKKDVGQINIDAFIEALKILLKK